MSQSQVLEDLDNLLHKQLEKICQRHLALCNAAGIPRRDAMREISYVMLQAAASLVATETNAPTEVATALFADLVTAIRRQEAWQSATNDQGSRS